MSGIKLVTLPPGSGYGDAGIQYLTGLSRVGVQITWSPIVASAADSQVKSLFRSAIPTQLLDTAFAHWRRPLDCDSMLIHVPPGHWQEHWLMQEPNLRAFTMIAWELEQIPPHWHELLNPFDAVFVPSTFNQIALRAGGITTDVHVTPHIAKAVEPIDEGPGWGDVEKDDYVFYAIGTWTSRKAMSETIRAYLDAFTVDDKVALIVKTEAVDQMATYAQGLRDTNRQVPRTAMVWWQLARMLAEYRRPPKLHLIAEYVTQLDVDRLHSRGDCFVNLSRSEGWGLGAFDAALFGNPVIITGYGGHLDFLGGDYPFLVPYEMRPTSESPPDGYFMHADDAFWAHADRAAAASLMRHVYENQRWAKDIALGLQPKIARAFSSDRISHHLASLMGQITV